MDCSVDGWCWENPRPHGNTSLALWGSAADDLWAAGEGGTILHWNGDAWSRTTGQPKATFESIWGRDRNDVWIVGWRSYDGSTVLHWNGATWTDMHFPAKERLAIVGGSDAGTVWVADIKGSVWSWDGQSWVFRVKAVCPPPPGGGGITCVWSVLRTAGGGTMLTPPGHGGYWDGSALVRGLAPPPPTHRSFGGHRESAFLLRSASLESGATEVETWDGSQWLSLGLPTSGPVVLTHSLGSALDRDGARHGYTKASTLRALWGVRDDDLWAVGDDGLILRYGGSSWHAVDGEARGDLDYVWGSGANDVWATGEAGIVHWDGVRWRSTVRSISTARLNGVWGVDACHLWAVGDAGTVLRRDCAGWSSIASGVAVDLWSVGGTGPDDVWVVGDAGTALHFDGRGRSQENASPHTLRSVWARSTDDAWAVGDQGTTLHWNGGRWHEIQSPTRGTLRAVRGLGANRAIAVGNAAEAIVWDGASWSALAGSPDCPFSSSDNLTGVWVRAMNDVWATCEDAGPLHWDGATRWRQPAEFAQRRGSHHFFDVAGSGDSLWLVDIAGTVFQKSGDRWTQPANSVAVPLRAVWASASGEVWAVGDRGTIVSYRPR